MSGKNSTVTGSALFKPLLLILDFQKKKMTMMQKKEHCILQELKAMTNVMMMMLMIFFFSCKYSIYSLTRINRPSCDNINGFFTYIAVGCRLQHMVIRSKMTINGISLVFLYITVVPVQICHIILFQKNLLAAVTVAVFHCFPTPKRWMLRTSSKPPCQRPCSY